MNGKINAINDIHGDAGAGIYVNGNIVNVENSPIINMSNTVSITSSGTGIYAAGYATYNVNGAYVLGEHSGIAIKSGIFNILNGHIIGKGDDKTPTTGNNNGVNSSGTAIQIESNSGYKGDIELNIDNGLFESNNSNVIYEYTVNSTSTKVNKIDITGGTFISNADKNVFSLSDSFRKNHQEFISGGLCSSNPDEYLKNGYSSEKGENSLFEVIYNTIDVFAETENSNTIFLTISIIIVLTIFLATIFYFNKKTINLLKYFYLYLIHKILF